MPHSLSLLRTSRLPLDWMTIAIGFNGAVSGMPFHLTRDEIQQYALDHLADAAGTPDEEPSFFLADADPTDWNAFPIPLATLAARSDVSRETALRKWRYSATRDFVDSLPQPEKWQFDDFENWCDFDLLWSDIVPDPPWIDDSLAGEQWGSTEIAVLLEVCHDWLKNERAQILAE